MAVELKLTDEQAEVLRQFMRGRMQGLMASARQMGYPGDVAFASDLLMAVGAAMPKEVGGAEQPPVDIGESDSEPDQPEPILDPEDKSKKEAEEKLLDPLPPASAETTGSGGGTAGDNPLNVKGKGGTDTEGQSPPPKPKSGSGARQGAATSKNLKG